MQKASHSVIKFERPPIVEGPLTHFNERRDEVVKQTISRAQSELTAGSPDLDLLLGEALYKEKQRLKRTRYNVFTRKRKKPDHQLWSRVQSGLITPQGEKDRYRLLDRVIGHYAQEISGHFDPRVYWMATRMVPFGFNWLLNAASMERILPWGLTQNLEGAIRIVGEVPHLQKLAKKGTILLVPTHQSNIDSVLIGWVIYMMGLPPFAYGAGLNLFSNPLLSFFMSNLGSYTVDRGKNNDIYKAVLKNYSTTILKDGVHSIFFPGGGRSRSGAIETKPKLGLLGTALESQLENTIAGKPNSNVYVVPMVMSYHFVLEAASLIEDFLAEQGKHRYIMGTDESWQITKVAKFFWQFFASQTNVTVRVGKPLDVFGNLVDEEGNSIGPNGTRIDPKNWFTSKGIVQAVPQRDQEYTRNLGNALVDRYHKDNTVLSSHAVAYALFELLKNQYKDLDLFRLLRLAPAQRTLPMDRFLTHADQLAQRLRALELKGQLHLSPELKNSDTRAWVDDGIKNLGVFHTINAVEVKDGTIHSEDMNLLLYYRNRLAGYEKRGL